MTSDERRLRRDLDRISGLLQMQAGQIAAQNTAIVVLLVELAKAAADPHGRLQELAGRLEGSAEGLGRLLISDGGDSIGPLAQYALQGTLGLIDAAEQAMAEQLPACPPAK